MFESKSDAKFLYVGSELVWRSTTGAIRFSDFTHLGSTTSSPIRRFWRPTSLRFEDNEIAAGFVLTCQTFPVSDTVTVDFDA